MTPFAFPISEGGPGVRGQRPRDKADGPTDHDRCHCRTADHLRKHARPALGYALVPRISRARLPRLSYSAERRSRLREHRQPSSFDCIARGPGIRSLATFPYCAEMRANSPVLATAYIWRDRTSTARRLAFERSVV